MGVVNKRFFGVGLFWRGFNTLDRSRANAVTANGWGLLRVDAGYVKKVEQEENTLMALSWPAHNASYTCMPLLARLHCFTKARPMHIRYTGLVMDCILDSILCLT